MTNAIGSNSGVRYFTQYHQEDPLAYFVGLGLFHGFSNAKFPKEYETASRDAQIWYENGRLRGVRALVGGEMLPKFVLCDGKKVPETRSYLKFLRALQQDEVGESAMPKKLKATVRGNVVA